MAYLRREDLAAVGRGTESVGREALLLLLEPGCPKIILFQGKNRHVLSKNRSFECKTHSSLAL